jgi:xanthine dehydrogenase YagR molybdenum-binding subunit
VSEAVLPAAGLARVEGREKVTGRARYAAEYPVEGVVHAVALQATIGRGEVLAVRPGEALALPGVLAVLWHGNAPRLGPVDHREVAVLQSSDVAYRGQVVGLVVAESLEVARHAAGLVRVDYRVEPHAAELLVDHPGLYRPPRVNPSYETDTAQGDFDTAFAEAPVPVDHTYRTPAEHNNPIEPHATLAVWEDGALTLYDANQGSSPVRDAVAKALGLEPARVRVITQHVGGGFGQKGGWPRPNVLLAAIAAQVTGRPVKLVLTRQQMFALVGYRTPTIQRVRLGAHPDGRLTAICHDVVEQSSTVHEFAEQTALATRMMYAAPNRRTTHRLLRLNVPTPAWMRAPGECPGMFALESAMDELAIACGLDPVELRVRNEPEVDPEDGTPFSSRGLVACLREGAARFGWAGRDPAPGARRTDRWLTGTGVAAATYPARVRPTSAAARVSRSGEYTVRLNATDIGQGARTALTAIAAEALEAPVERVRVEIGDSDLPPAGLAGGSMGTASWGTAVVKACRRLREELAAHDLVPPADGLEVSVDTAEEVRALERLARYAFGAQFAEVRVDVDTGEVRVPRMLGVFAAGRIINPRTARSQLLGGMIMGLSMALHEESVMDARFGDYVNHDLAGYHVAANADVRDIQAVWIDEVDPRVNPLGAKGIGEIGIVGAAAAIANAVYHATGVRVRDLPIYPEKVLGHA